MNGENSGINYEIWPFLPVVVQIIIHIVALFKLVFCCFSNCFKLHLPLVYICEHISLLSLAYKRGSHRSLYQGENKQHKRGELDRHQMVVRQVTKGCMLAKLHSFSQNH